ncbi:putative mitochondrial chaperone bcs1 [Dendryphion nanum]|uniref:Mitochondrial chaperone bcs1 n=1 Tax=Dendryphion nanum TaxID=256645 RepID=A0A9P9I9A4_9PLEO|nr:putative mitochondrial chaperone bcs1 [Dendryphion nanum]
MASLNNVNSAYVQPLLSENIHLLNLFLPGLASATSVLPLLTGASSIYGRLFCVCVLLLLVGKYVSETIVGILETYFITRVEIPHNDVAYDMLMSWVSSRPFAKKARTSLVTVDLKLSTRSNSSDSDANKKSLHFSPCNGYFYFRHKGNQFAFKRSRSQVEFGHTREEVCVSYFGWNTTVLRELLDECRQYYLKQVKNKTCVFDHEGNRWKNSKARNKRDVSTVIVKEKVKEMLLGDVAEFLDPETREWYTARGLPYQRGYLLYGPPGTGKSSLGLSIAGHFDLDIYVLTMSSLNDESLKALFAELPQHCIVLLEDIDAVAVHRTQEDNTDPSQNGSTRKSTDGKVTLSTLLNVLDGVGSPEGRVVIMTTNYIQRLDPALIRPGRVDMKVEFQLADKSMLSHLFFFVFGRQPPSSDASAEKQVSRDEEMLKLAEEFAAKVPKGQFSPAEIMSLLLVHRLSPLQAIADVDVWMKKIGEERKAMMRSNSWVLHDDN